MKRIAIIASGLLLTLGTLAAQSGYKTHVIKAGESLSQLAKQYGTTVGDIMRLNKMSTDSKLFVGEEVKIPAAGETIVAAAAAKTHVVEKGETLYQLSKKFNVSVNDLRDWNNIVGNNIQVGQTLRLGAPGTGDTPQSVPVDTNAPASVPADVPATPVATEPEDTGATIPAISSTSTDKASDSSTEAPADTKQREGSVFDPNTSGGNTTSSAEGAFAVAYKSQASGTELITKGVAGAFKSASGWKDGKYFILMNEIAPGTLVKVQTKGKTIYAKVLWNLGNVKENAGLSYRISDAAVSALGVGGDQFDIIVSYFKE
ncbi:MAG TPA: LysM peptidoglycan-binding domain-containing protein [Arachidicoccus sp.]|nr:LysM peptidoglycan-binding domain-containing protein [Arachidicoccus sp.]